MTPSDSRSNAQPTPPTGRPATTDSTQEVSPRDAALVASTMAHHPDIPTVGPLAGAFTWDVLADEWSWSDEMYAIHGFAPHAVVPTTDLLTAHKHPDDRAKTQRVVERFLTTGERYACYHRIIDANSQERHVLVVAGGLTDPGGTVTEMSGFMIDLTSARRHDLQPAIDEALDGALQNRGDIDMAKGAIMLSFNTDPDEAFAVLRAVSNRSNLKISDIASRIVNELALGDRPHRSATDVEALMTLVTQPDYVSRRDHDET